VAQLEARGIRVYCLALGGVDLTSSAGKLTMSVINAVAQFERDLLIERTQAGLARAKAEGKTLGRPPRCQANDKSSCVKGWPMVKASPPSHGTSKPAGRQL